MSNTWVHKYVRYDPLICAYVLTYVHICMMYVCGSTFVYMCVARGYTHIYVCGKRVPVALPPVSPKGIMSLI